MVLADTLLRTTTAECIADHSAGSQAKVCKIGFGTILIVVHSIDYLQEDLPEDVGQQGTRFAKNLDRALLLSGGGRSGFEVDRTVDNSIGTGPKELLQLKATEDGGLLLPLTDPFTVIPYPKSLSPEHTGNRGVPDSTF
ncbi:hypothetical protein A0H81_02328 [Grifola frondosa]|uniref:Uncharacterized protein n=1 Tax=Grifola frondosa TaxID=5627 RepID=A0A1C7MMH9_GRIFR|nr:hypothetical protein A0H81_02328 [Grifola frondosa]